MFQVLLAHQLQAESRAAEFEHTCMLVPGPVRQQYPVSSLDLAGTLPYSWQAESQ